MNKRKSYKIFSSDYLINGDFTDDDLRYLFETNSLCLSLIVDMFIKTKQEVTDEKTIVSLVKENDWMYKYFWTERQRETFTDEVVKIFKNVYFCGDEIALSKAQWWITLYGLTNSKMRNRKISKLCE